MLVIGSDRWTRWACAITALVAALTFAYGDYQHQAHGKFGTAAPPFVAGWLPHVAPLGALAAVLVCAFVVWAGGALLRAKLSAAGIGGLLYLLALGAGLAVNVARHGPRDWIAIFDLGRKGSPEAINEYLPGLPALRDGAHNYLDRFAQVVTSQPVNIAGHPPGPLLLAHWFGINTAAGLAALVIALGSACAPLTYRLTLTLSGDQRIARVGGLLCVASPVMLLFGVTSYDYAFAAFAALAACLLVARTRRWQVAGMAALAVAAFMSWALLAVGAWAAIVIWRRDGLRAAIVVAAGCGIAVAALLGFFAATYGYDPIGTLRATEQVYRQSLSTTRPYLYWLFGSPVAWALMLGPLIVAGALRGAQLRDGAAIAIVAVVLIAAIGGFTKAETERIWLFMVPLACAAAAPHLRSDRVRVILAILLAQALIFELLMNTVW